MTRRVSRLALSALLLLTFTYGRAQVTPSTETALGSSPYAVYNGGGIDSINPINGNVFLHIPLLSYPQRGHALRLAFDTYYNDKRWFIKNFSQNSQTGQVQGQWAYFTGGGPTSNTGVYVARDQHLEFGLDLATSVQVTGEQYDPTTTTIDSFNYWLREPNGSQHYDGDAANYSCSGPGCTPPAYPSYGNSYPTSDGSGYVGTNLSILGRDGVNYAVSSDSGSASNYESITDKAGNSISVSASGWTDTEGRVIPGTYGSPGTSDGIEPVPGGVYAVDPIPGIAITPPSQCSGASAARQWTVPNPSGSPASYYLCYNNITISTAFNIDATTGSTIYGGVQELSGTAPLLLTAVVLPNGTAYRFAYDSYLSLQSITLPTGGQISYVWQNLSVSGQATGLGSIPVTRALKTRTVTPGGGQPSGTWSYHRYYNAPNTKGSPNTPFMWTVVTDPAGNDVEHQVGGTDPNGNSVGEAESMTSSYTGCSPHDTASNRSCSGSSTLISQVQYGLQAYSGISNSSNAAGLFRRTSEASSSPSSAGTLTNMAVLNYVPNYGSCTVNSFSGPASFPSPTYPQGCYTTNQLQSSARYDYGALGSGAAGPLLNTTTTNYIWQSQTTYQSANLLDLVASVVVTDGSGTRAGETDFAYDETGSPQGVFGNQTSTTSWLNTGTSPASHTTYNTQGMPITMTDALGNVEQLNYQCAGSLLLSTILPYKSSTTTSETTTYGYDCTSGYRTSVTDPNSVATTYTYDSLGRIVKTAVPNASSVSISYNGDPLPPHVTTTTATGTSTPPIVSDTYYDGVGRVTKSASTSDPSTMGAATVTTTYDQLGRVGSVSNPQRSTSSPTDGTISYTYDALGRVIVETQQDGSTLLWCYNGVASIAAQQCGSRQGTTTGLQVDFSDELRNTTQRIYDGSSRLTSVFEPGGLETDYKYDALNNLIKVNQTGGSTNSALFRVRTFAYDSLSRLLASSTPEKATTANPPQLTCSLAPTGPWTECFAYDANGNPTKHTDNRNIVSTLTYDALNRLLTKTYSDGTPAVAYTYDTGYFTYPPETNPAETSGSQTNLVGRLAYETTTDSTGKGVTTKTGYSYDALGRVLIKTSCTPRTCTPNTYSGNINDQYDMHYAYDEAGNTTYAGNGLLAKKNAASPGVGYYYSGLNLSYQGSSQVLNAHSDLPVDTTHPNQDIATGITYNPLGNIASASAGDELGQTFTYAPRGWLLTTNQTDLNGNQKIMDTSNRDLHGNLVQDTDSKLGLFVFCYDPLGRLYASYGPYTGTAPACGSLMSSGTLYTYDAFGTLDGRQVYGGSNYQFSFVPNVHNQDPSSRYDAAGNLLSDGIHTYTYDAEGRINTVDGSTQYFYDAEGNRVAEGTGGTTPSTDFLYDLNGHLITTVGSNFKTTRTTLYAAGRHWGDYTAGTGSGGGQTEYRLSNLVGSLYFNYDQGGSLLESCQLGVFGEAMNCTPSVDFTETHFADQKRDQESNLDYLGARYYSSSLGRFMSPDPSGLYYANPANPQGLNLYSYGQNNPLTNIDPTGKDCIHINNDTGNYEGTDIGDCDNSTETLANSGHYVDGTVASLSYNAGSGNYSFSYYSYDQSSNAVSSNGIIAGAGQPITVPLSADELSYAMSQTTPVSGFYTYGNYAGSGGMGIPRNNADAGALKHDYCYSKAGKQGFGANIGHSDAVQACNQALCDTESQVAANLRATANAATQNGQRTNGSVDYKELNAAGDIVDFFSLVPFGNGCQTR